MDGASRNAAIQAYIWAAAGQTLRTQWEKTDHIDLLNRAVELYEKAVSLQTINTELYSNELADALYSRFKKTGSITDLNRSVDFHRMALRSSSANSSAYELYLLQLAEVLDKRFETLKFTDDQNEAIGIWEEVLTLTPHDHERRAKRLIILANNLERRFDRTEDGSDIERAISLVEEALALTPSQDPEHAVCLSTIATLLQARFEKKGSVSDLDRAISYADRALSSFPSNHPIRPLCLGTIGNALQSRFKLTEHECDIERAILAAEEAIGSTAEDSSIHWNHVNNLCAYTYTKYGRRGSVNDLDRSIALGKQVLANALADDSNRGMQLCNLGAGLFARFQRTGSIDDVNAAINSMERAVEAVVGEPSQKALYLHNLSAMMRAKWEHNRSTQDINQTITIAEQAISLTDDDDPALVLYTSNLCSCILSQFEETGSIDYLNKVISMAERMENIAHNASSHYLSLLVAGGIALHRRFDLTGSLDDINRSVFKIQQAVDASLNDNPDRSLYLTRLASVLLARFKLTDSNVDLTRALEAYEKAVGVTTAPPLVRIQAAFNASPVLISCDPHRALLVLRTAVELLSNIAPRTLRLGDQLYNISQFAGLTALAVSVSLECGESNYDSLQLLDLGKGIIAGLQLETRSDLSILKSSHPNLAAEFENIREQLSAPWNDVLGPHIIVETDIVEHRRFLSQKFNSLLDSIRSLEGFERFLLAPSVSELKALAIPGPIIVFNVSDLRSDVFVVTKSEIRSHRLTNLNAVALKGQAQRLLECIKMRKSCYAIAMDKISKLLEWLWDVAVDEILDGIGFKETPLPGAEWPRVWWIGSGLLNLFPIHAAGYHESSSRNALDRVISSYALTMKALVHARQSLGRLDCSGTEKALLVGMPTTPDRADLPFAMSEIDELQKLMYSHIETTVKINPVKKDILSTIPDHQIVHLACHGYSSLDPSQSKVLLNDWQTDPLTVMDFMSLNSPTPQFAYLSACHTASSQDFHLLDETINVAAAVHFAGCPSVVGTLWGIVDDKAAVVAKILYRWMLTSGDRMDYLRAAEGLHYAVRIIRERTRIVEGFNRKAPNNPLVWAPFIHLGI